jgi:hypothetical protein
MKKWPACPVWRSRAITLDSLIDRSLLKWDIPTMKICRVDSKKRIVLPDGKPGDWMLIEESSAGTYTLKRVAIPEVGRKTRAAARKAIREVPLKMEMDWEALRKLTREP